MSEFAGQFAIVTGGGGGIGRALCQLLAQKGAAVWAVGRTPSTLDETVAGCGPQGHGFKADLTDDGEVARLASEAERTFGKVDILVHSAGVIAHGPLAEMPIESLDAQYRSNVRLPY